MHRSVSLRRPLSSATAALRGAPPPGRARRGAELLIELLDFEGSVALAHVLATQPLTPLTPLAGAVTRARRRLSEAGHDAERPLTDPHTGAPLISAERVASVLGRAGVPAARSKKAIEGAARDLFAPLEARTQKRIGASRRFLAELRRDLGPTIRASGPIGARLEQIDAALTAATAARADALVARALGAIGDAFAADLERAVLDLPKPCPGLPVAEWTGGFVADHVGRCEALALAAFLHERARIEMLVESALGERLA
jgi:hypothetical protein